MEKKLGELKVFEQYLKGYKKSVETFSDTASRIQERHISFGKTVHVIYDKSPYESAVNETANTLRDPIPALTNSQSTLASANEIIGEVSSVMSQIKGQYNVYNERRMGYDHYSDKVQKLASKSSSSSSTKGQDKFTRNQKKLESATTAYNEAHAEVKALIDALHAKKEKIRDHLNHQFGELMVPTWFSAMHAHV